MKRQVLSAVAVAGVLLASGCGTAADSASGGGPLPAEVTIGVPFDTSGAAAVASVGTDQNEGVKLAVKEINDSGFLGSTKIKTQEVDTKGDKQEAVQAVLQLISARVPAVLGFTLTPSFLAAAPQLQSAKIPTVAVGLSASGVTEVGDYMFRVYPNMANVIPKGDVEFARAYGARRIAFMVQSDAAAAVEIHEGREKALRDAGFEIVQEQTFASNDTDVRAQLTAIKDANPDLVVTTPLPGLMSIVYLQAAEVGLRAQILASPDVNDAILSQAGRAMQCVAYTTAWNPKATGGNNAAFLEAWSRNGVNKTANVFHAAGYTSMWTLARGLKAANSTNGAALRDALANLPVSPTPFGDLAFDQNRAMAITGTKVQVRDSKLELWQDATSCRR